MEVRKYWALLRRRFWIILVSAILAGVIAFVVNSNRVKLYRSTAEFLIDVAASGGQRDYVGGVIAEGLVPDYLEIIPTSPIAREVIVRLKDDYPEMANWSPQTLLRKVSLNSPFETQIINISVVDEDAERAADIANMMGLVFGEVNAERLKSRFSVPIEKLDDQLAELDEGIGEIQIQISQFGDAETAAEEAELSRLDRSLNELQTNYNTAFQTRLDLDIDQARSLNDFIGTEPAIVSRSPISPRTNSNTVLAAAVAAFAALGVVLLLDYMDDTVKSPVEVFDHTGLSSLATISYIEGANPPDRLIAHKAPRDPVSEAYRMLRTNLSFASISSEMNCVLVTSSSPGEGKSTTSANVATVLAQTGRRVILVDADLRRPSQHKIFELATNLGLTTALLDTTMPITHHLQQTKVPGLRLMASGPVPPNPAELLNSPRMREVLDGLLKDADFVLVDTPPVLTVADAAILAPNVNGCVIVAQVGKTRMELLAHATERMRNAGANMYGVVMNRYSQSAAGYYYHDNNTYYAQDYKTETTDTSGGPRRVLATLFGFGD